jgi:hypothetical protein
MEHAAFSNALFNKSLVLVKASADTSYRIIETLLKQQENIEVRWHSDTIEALADIFFSKPKLLIVFEDSNTEGFDFLELVRNNPQFVELQAFLILPEPLKLKHKLRKSLGKTERFSTPIDHGHFFEVLKKTLA